MTSKERVRNAIEHRAVDRVPVDFGATAYVYDMLKNRYGVEDNDGVLDRLEIDIRQVNPEYRGPEFEKEYVSETDYMRKNQWGGTGRFVWTGVEYNGMSVDYPLGGAETIEAVESFEFPRPEWYDFSTIAEQCDKYEGKAIIAGHEGPYQIVGVLMPDDQVYINMALYPDMMKRLYERIHEWEIERYTRLLEAGGGRIDILRTHDDYGTQRNMLFSLDMWRDFFEANTRALVDLAHSYGAYFMQHSCGAVRPIIPRLIDCGVDALNPVQPVTGMDPESLREEFGGKISFNGGIDTQHLLPFGTPDEVTAEVRRYIDALNIEGGYVLNSSQSWESCIPAENIEAMYSVRD